MKIHNDYNRGNIVVNGNCILELTGKQQQTYFANGCKIQRNVNINPITQLFEPSTSGIITFQDCDDRLKSFSIDYFNKILNASTLSKDNCCFKLKVIRERGNGNNFCMEFDNCLIRSFNDNSITISYEYQIS